MSKLSYNIETDTLFYSITDNSTDDAIQSRSHRLGDNGFPIVIPADDFEDNTAFRAYKGQNTSKNK